MENAEADDPGDRQRRRENPLRLFYFRLTQTDLQARISPLSSVGRSGDSPTVKNAANPSLQEAPHGYGF